MFDVKYSKEEIATAFTIDYKNWCCSYKVIATHMVWEENSQCVTITDDNFHNKYYNQNDCLYFSCVIIQ